jgi:DNA (cytosine-5)-methyltransferase 1
MADNLESKGIKYFSMFSGIGGFELGIQNAYRSANRGSKSNQTANRNESETSEDVSATQGQSSPGTTDSTDQRPLCVGYSEIDKYAIKTYERHYGHTNYGNATTINPADLPDFDLLVGGFPCQAFSIAGKRAGFNDTRGTLFFDIARILKHKRPRHLVLENVKGLLSHDGGKTFQTILGVLSDLGYLVEWQVLNSKDFGVPQNRERVFIVGHLGGECKPKVFPIRQNDGLDNTTQRTEKQEVQSIHRCLEATEYKGVSSERFTGIQDRLRPDQQNPRTGGVESDSTNRIRRTSYTDGMRIRRLTPKECERLQGFPDDWTAGESDTQRYKMCGNAVTVNVVQAVMEKLYEI